MGILVMGSEVLVTCLIIMGMGWGIGDIMDSDTRDLTRPTREQGVAINSPFDDFVEKHMNFFQEFRNKHKRHKETDNPVAIDSQAKVINSKKSQKFDPNLKQKEVEKTSKIKIKNQKENLRKLTLMISKLLFQLSKMKE